MSTVITRCPKCSSDNIKDINPELKRTSQTITVKITAICNECNTEFAYTSATEYGYKTGILY